MKVIMMVAVASLALVGGTAEVAFTGGSDGSSRDLSLAENWTGGSIPAGNDLATVDASRFGNAYTVSQDVTLPGLKISGQSDTSKIDGSGTLSLGAGGLTYANGTGGVQLWAKMTVTADQIWDFGGMQLYNYTTYGGTSALSLNNWKGIEFYFAPQYAGPMMMKGVSSSSRIVCYQSRAWANTVEVTQGSVCFSLNDTDPVKFFKLFPGRSFVALSAADVTHTSGATLLFEEDDVFRASCSYSQVTHGGISVCGGSYSAGTVFEFAGMGGTSSQESDKPVSFSVSDGSFDVGQQFMMGAQTKASRLAVQTGGAVSAGAFYIGGGPDQTTGVVAEYRHEGGTMTDKGGANDRGLMMGGFAQSDNANSPAGIFTQTAGDLSFSHVSWGSRGGYWGYTDSPNGRAYGLLDLRGGSFTLPAEGFVFAQKWNSGTVSNSTYDVRLNGGTFKTSASSDIGLAMTVGAGDGASTWDTGSFDNRLTASLDGNGVLRKKGAGKLTLTDACRFKGGIDVREGVLEVEGVLSEPSGYVAGGNCLVFTADSLAGTCNDGDEVSSWSDTTGSVSWRKPLDGEISKYETYKVPTFKSNAIGGRPGLCFDSGHVLSFSADNNPLAGETNFSMVVVFNPDRTGQGCESDGNAFAGRGIIGNERGWNGGVANDLTLILNQDKRMFVETCNKDPDHTREGLYSPTMAVDGSTAAIAIVSMRGNRLTLDFNNGIETRTFETFDNFSPRFAKGETRYPLYLGTTDVDGDGCVAARCFSGAIAEVRFYRKRALSEAEQRSLMVFLAEKYRGKSVADEYVRNADGALNATLVDARVAPAAKEPTVTWTPEFMSQTFDAAEGGCVEPELVQGAWNGRSALRFDAGQNTLLSIPEGANGDPLAGCGSYAVSFVFRTTTDVDEGTDDVGVGIYSATLDTTKPEKSSVGISSYCSVGTVQGSVSGDAVLNSCKPCRLNDGLPHVVVYSGNAATGVFQLMVDGVYIDRTMQSGTAWPTYGNSSKHVIGALGAGVGHFTGDLSSLKFWKEELTEDQMLAVSRQAACDYDFNLKERRAFTIEEIASRGLGATNLTVASGAVLRMPWSRTAPFVLPAGGTLSGAGTFLGSYRFGAGSILDFSTLEGSVDDIQLADGATMRFPKSGLPVDGSNVSSVSGRIAVDVSAVLEESMPRWTLLMSLPPEALSGSVTFDVVGNSDVSGKVVYDARRGGLLFKAEKGFSVILH